jgi:hypothetical protein
MKTRCRWLAIAAFGAWAIGCAPRGRPSPSPTKAPPSAAPAASSPGPRAEEPAPSESDERDRECELTVRASAHAVERALTDYERYATILPNFGRSRVLRRTADSSDVYLQVPILRGAANLWGVVRFVGPAVGPDGARIEGRYLRQGNVSAFHCLWRYRPVDDANTTLHLALLVLPQVPLPESVIESELTGACRDAVQGVKAYVEARSGPPDGG